MSQIQSNILPSSNIDNQIQTPGQNIQSLVTPMGKIDQMQPSVGIENDGRQSNSMQQSRTKPFSRGHQNNDQKQNTMSGLVETQQLQDKIQQNNQYMQAQYQKTIQKQRQLRDRQKMMSFMSQQYNKALFTLAYLTCLQLRKYMEMFNSIVQLKPEDLTDPNIMAGKQEQITKSLEKFKKHFGKNLDALNEKEVHKKVSPKFTVCFMDLASYMNISVQPIMESAENVKDKKKEDKEFQASAIDQLERQNPSVIKEEYEHEDNEDDTNVVEHRLVDSNEVFLQNVSKTETDDDTPKTAPIPNEEPKIQSRSVKNIKNKDNRGNKLLNQQTFNFRKGSNISQNSDQRMIEELYQKSKGDIENSRDGSRSHKRNRTLETPVNLLSERDKFNNSIKSMGVSEISNAFNMHFGARGDQDNTMSLLSYRSPSINYGGAQPQFPDRSESLENETQIQVYSENDEVRQATSSPHMVAQAAKISRKRNYDQKQNSKANLKAKTQNLNNTVQYVDNFNSNLLKQDQSIESDYVSNKAQLPKGVKMTGSKFCLSHRGSQNMNTNSFDSNRHQIPNRTFSKGSIKEHSKTNFKMPALKTKYSINHVASPDKEFTSTFDRQQQDKYAELDRKANEQIQAHQKVGVKLDENYINQVPTGYQKAPHTQKRPQTIPYQVPNIKNIGKNVKNQLRNSKDFAKESNKYERISTRYNYQNNNGILSYLEQEKNIQMHQAMNHGIPQNDWTKQAVNLTSQLIKGSVSQTSHRKGPTPNRIRKQPIKDQSGYSHLYHQTDANQRSQSRTRGIINNTISAAPIMQNLDMPSFEQTELSKAGQTFKESSIQQIIQENVQTPNDGQRAINLQQIQPNSNLQSKIGIQEWSRGAELTDQSYFNPNSLDASLTENTQRTDFYDPLDQHHAIAQGTGSVGNIYNVTNNINYQYDNRNIVNNHNKHTIQSPVPQYGYFKNRISKIDTSGFSNGFESMRESAQFRTRRQQNSLAHQTSFQNSKNKNVKLKPFSKAYLKAAKEHQKKGSKSPLKGQVPQNNSLLHDSTISGEGSISRLVNMNTTRPKQDRNVTRKSLLTNSIDLQQEIQQVQNENKALHGIVQAIEKKAARKEFIQEVNRDRCEHEKKMIQYQQDNLVTQKKTPEDRCLL